MAKAKPKRKAKQKRATSHSDFAGKKPDDSELAKLIADADKVNAKVARLSSKMIRHHILLITQAQAASDQAKAKAASARKILSNRFKTAGIDGMDVPALKKAFRESERPMPEVVAEQRNIGLYLREMDVELGHQWSMFDSPNVDVKAMGEHAGRNGQPADENPHKPGSEQHVLWDEGHRSGQAALAAGIGQSNGSEAHPN